MRPEGCQETHPQTTGPHDFLQPTHFKPVFGPQLLDAAENGDLYSFDDWPAHLSARRRSPDRRAAADAGASVRRPLQRSIYVSVLNDAGAPVPDLGPVGFRSSAKTTCPARSCGSGRSRRRCSVALMVDTSAAGRANIRDIREAAIEFIKGVTGTEVKHQVALIGVGERPTVLVDYTSDQAKLLKGIGLDLHARSERRLPARRRHRSVEGLQEARGAAARSSSRSPPGDRSSATATTTRC